MITLLQMPNDEVKNQQPEVAVSSLIETSQNQGISFLDFDTLLNMLDASYDSFSNCNASLGEVLTDTIEKKMEVEVDVQTIYEDILSEGSDKIPKLNREMHSRYIHEMLNRPLPAPFSKLDASKTWIAFWLMNSAALIDNLNTKEQNNAAKQLMYFYKTSSGSKNTVAGFGGGLHQLPHLAASYAAVLALLLSKNENAWREIDTQKVKKWLLQCKNKDGSFSMHVGGESDTRAAYCALCIAQLLNILDDDLRKGVADWLIKCQTYEGGFAGAPGDEAHGGYTFCALSALFILLNPDELMVSGLNLEILIKWTVDRQYSLEGGFSGRTNKLVDGCYSHWVGGTVALLELLINYNKYKINDPNKYLSLIDRQRLQNYILCCCQDTFGLRDKPGMNSDFYHTNYVLCGLSMCQHFQIYDPSKAQKYGNAFSAYPIEIEQPNTITILDDNHVLGIDAIFGVPYGYALNMYTFFSNL